MTNEDLNLATFRDPPREFGILPFWFLNGELDPDEMRFQLRELRDKGMHGVVLHGRFGLEMPYIGETYLDRIALAAEEADKLGLATWIYDEMNWPSGTADKRVLAARPDLAERYIECVGFTIQGPWFMCLTGGDSRYLDFERSSPVAAFAIGEGGEVVDLTPNLSFENVVPWEVPPGTWRLMYVVEKRADYYIDALDPEATTEFLRLGYRPYVDAIGPDFASKIVGFYSDEPAMHYFESGGDNAILPWTKDMFRRFRERNGYDLRPRLPDLFFDVAEDAARVRYDFYSTLTEFYTNAYYAQIHQWCRAQGVRFTAHLLYEEWLRRMIRVEGNPFRHYEHMDVVAVDHLYPVIGTRGSPDQHVAMKVASSAAHHVGSERVICESFGGIFMDATMQRMKWIADWECVLGINLINPHGFHYTLEGPRKRDWPPSMFYQYPWWPYYGEFSRYIGRVSYALSGGRHVAKVALLWPINAMFATYTPQQHDTLGDRIEGDFNALTDLLLRLHHDFDYLDEDVLARATIEGGTVRVGDEAYELVVLPPVSHVKLGTLERLERFVAGGGRVLGTVFLPAAAFGPEGLVDVSGRVEALFGVDPRETQASFAHADGVRVVVREHAGGGRAAFLRAGGIVRTGTEVDANVTTGVREAVAGLVDPDVRIDNEELFCLHRAKDDRDLYFVVNPTFEEQHAGVSLTGDVAPVLWDPSTGEERRPASVDRGDGRTRFPLTLPPTGSAFVVVPGTHGLDAPGPLAPTGEPVTLGGDWEFEALDDNALVLRAWLAVPEEEGHPAEEYAGCEVDERGWLRVVNGAWTYQVPGGPTVDLPWPVWFRVGFDVEVVPGCAELVIDGFAGVAHELYVNGRRVTKGARRSPFDSQMKTVAIHDLLERGRNVVAVRLVVGGPTDGLLDLVKIVGEFALAGKTGAYRIATAPRVLAPAPWTGQGYPFLSGRGRYTRRFELPEALARRRVLLETPMGDDVLDVTVNGELAGVRLWPPYSVELTHLLRPGENVLELTVANTLANLLSGVERPSGIAGAPFLVPVGAAEGGAR